MSGCLCRCRSRANRPGMCLASRRSRRWRRRRARSGCRSPLWLDSSTRVTSTRSPSGSRLAARTRSPGCPATPHVGHYRVGVSVPEAVFSLQPCDSLHVLLVRTGAHQLEPHVDRFPVSAFDRREVRRRALCVRRQPRSCQPVWESVTQSSDSSVESEWSLDRRGAPPARPAFSGCPDARTAQASR